MSVSNPSTLLPLGEFRDAALVLMQKRVPAPNSQERKGAASNQQVHFPNVSLGSTSLCHVDSLPHVYDVQGQLYDSLNFIELSQHIISNYMRCTFEFIEDHR